MNDPTLFKRMAVLAASGFSSEAEMADAMLELVGHLGRELIAGGKLSKEQSRGVASALNDTPIVFSAITQLPLPESDKQFITFALAKLIEDMLSLGSVAMIAGDKNIAKAVSKGGSIGGATRAVQLKKQKREWQEKALELAQSLLRINSGLTQADLARKITDNWKNDWPRLPQEKRIIAFLSQSIRAGRLPKRVPR